MRSMRIKSPAILFFCLSLLPLHALAEDKATTPDRKTMLDAAREVIESATSCALVTIGSDGGPRVRMMDPFAPEPDMTVWLATNNTSRKATEIRENPHIALYYVDADGPGYVTIRGTARLVDDPKEKTERWKDGWEMFYGESRSSYILIEVTPESLELVSYRHGIVSTDPRTWKVPTVVFEP